MISTPFVCVINFPSTGVYVVTPLIPIGIVSPVTKSPSPALTVYSGTGSPISLLKESALIVIAFLCNCIGTFNCGASLYKLSPALSTKTLIILFPVFGVNKTDPLPISVREA